MMWFLSGIDDVPTPNVRLDVWDCVEPYAMHILLARRLKIIPTSNLKLINSFLVLHIVLLSLLKSLSRVASTWHAHFTLRVNLRVSDRPSALCQKFLPHAKFLACGFAFMRQLSFYAIACESVFYVLPQEANKNIFYMVLQGGSATKRHIARERWQQFALHIAQEAMTRLLFFMSYCNK
jgi:hypothetical protein